MKCEKCSEEKDNLKLILIHPRLYNTYNKYFNLDEDKHFFCDDCMESLVKFILPGKEELVKNNATDLEIINFITNKYLEFIKPKMRSM